MNGRAAPIQVSLTLAPPEINWMVSGTVSLTVMICTQLAELVQSSVTRCVRVIVPPHAPTTSGPSEQV